MSAARRRGRISITLGPVEAEAMRRAIGAFESQCEGEDLDVETRRDLAAVDRVHGRVIRASAAKWGNR